MDAYAVRWMHMKYDACICSTMTTWSPCMHMHYHDFLIIKSLALFWILDWIYMSMHILRHLYAYTLFSHDHYLVSWIILSCSWQGRHLSVLGRMKKVVRRSARINPKPATLSSACGTVSQTQSKSQTQPKPWTTPNLSPSIPHGRHVFSHSVYVSIPHALHFSISQVHVSISGALYLSPVSSCITNPQNLILER